jgi:hypothetical protein
LDSNTRLRVATRIHHALMRQLGETVAVNALLDGSAEGREALWVCEASEDRELVDLAKHFRRAGLPQQAPTKAVGGRAKQENTWAQNTTGFGVSRPVGLGTAARPAEHAGTPRLNDDGAAHWLSPSSWFGALRTSQR